jgi:hypothetical protein
MFRPLPPSFFIHIYQVHLPVHIHIYYCFTAGSSHTLQSRFDFCARVNSASRPDCSAPEPLSCVRVSDRLHLCMVRVVTGLGLTFILYCVGAARVLFLIGIRSSSASYAELRVAERPLV